MEWLRRSGKAATKPAAKANPAATVTSTAKAADVAGGGEAKSLPDKSQATAAATAADKAIGGKPEAVSAVNKLVESSVKPAFVAAGSPSPQRPSNDQDLFCVVGSEASVQEAVDAIKLPKRTRLRVFLVWQRGTFGVMYDSAAAKRTLKDEGDKALIRVAQALRKATCPCELLLYACNLSDAGINFLVDALGECTVCTFLYVDYNPDISLACYERLKRAVATSPSPIENLRIFDLQKMPKVEFEATQAALKQAGYDSPLSVSLQFNEWCCMMCSGR